jgi:hypothetical protein
MGRYRTARFVLALLLSLVSVRAFAGTVISVNLMPPPLPAYDQPPCPDQNLIWTPGYWAWFQNDYYWVPGAWVEPPFPGAMWTPGYWNWSHHLFTMYTWHSGYWSYHVGYYGGVNYGYGYGGFGYSGGVWHDGLFAYNLEIVRVDDRYVRETFRDPGLVDQGYIDRNNHAGFNGGPGGVSYQISPGEQAVEHERHWEATSFQQQYEGRFRDDRSYWYRTNQGRPEHPAYATPLFVDPSHEHRDWNDHRDLYDHRDQQANHDQGDHHDQPINHDEPINHDQSDHRDANGYRPGNNQVQQNPNGQQQFHPDAGQHPPAGNEHERNPNNMPLAGQPPANPAYNPNAGAPPPSHTPPPPPPANLHPNNPPPGSASKPAPKPADKPAPKPADKSKTDKDKKPN